MTRPNLNAVALVPQELEGAIASTGFHVLRAIAVQPSWLYYAVQTNAFVAAMSQVVQGALYPAVRPNDIRGCPVLLPPKAEQDRICDALDELLSDLDAGVAAIERVLVKLAEYRAAVLKAAVEGALTADWRKKHRKVEPASALLTRILTERRRRWEEEQLRKLKEAGKEPPKNWKAKYQEPLAPDTTNLPLLPKAWCWCNLDQLKHFSLYGPRFSSEDYTPQGIYVLRTSDINDSGKVALETAPRLKLRDDEFKPYELKEGDILFTRTGSIGRLSVFNDSVSAVAGAYLIQYRLATPGDLSWYLFRFFQSPIGQNHLIGRTAGVGRPNLNAPNIESIPIPLPPADETPAILEAVEGQLSVIEHLEADLGAKLKSAQALRQSILRHAFTGQLVPQDPKDEPAAELLKRIAVEREERARQALAAKRAAKSPIGNRKP